jgi:hypothetical protein
MADDRQRAEQQMTHDTRAEREADAVVADVDDYVAHTNPASLPQAEQALEDWQIPSSPFDGVSETGLAGDAQTAPLVSVLSVGTESEANIVRGVLEAEGIAVIFREVATPAYGSVFSVSEARWADLLVSAADAERAQQVIESAMQQNEGA